MKSLIPIPLLIALCLVTGGSPQATAARVEGAQVIDVTARKYEFNPSSIRVKQGTKVQLKITATDHVHGFIIDDTPETDTKGSPGLIFASTRDCTRIEEGKTETVEFVAQKPGTYRFRCCVHCDCDHREMKGQLIVEP